MSEEKHWTHLDDQGRATMVDVGDKASSDRRAHARARLRTRPEVVRRLLEGDLPKGEALAVARIAGIQAAKRCSDTIPLCHPLALSSVEVSFEAGEDGASVQIDARVRCTGKTGVEMEAMCAAAVAALTLYDMAKALDHFMLVEAVGLIEKSGGRSGTMVRDGVL
jgi:cyclic pyranopterin phosphate synthase